MPSVPKFPDLANHWAQAAVTTLTQRGLFRGYPDGSFRPEATITRAEFAVLVAQVFPDAPAVRARVSFTDVPTDYWAYAAVDWVYTRGFFSGYPDHTFQAALPLPRVQALVVLVSGLGYMPPREPDRILKQYFEDWGAIPSYAKVAIASATLNNLVVNYPQVEYFRPQHHATRAEISALCCQVLNVLGQVPSEYVAGQRSIVEIKLSQAKNSQQVFQHFLAQEEGFTAAKLPFLDRGIEKSPCQPDLGVYPARLQQKPGADHSAGRGKTLGNFQPYPPIGQIPAIDESALEFLHPDIEVACVCVGDFLKGNLVTRWLGRNALKSLQLWSTTKIIPLLHVISEANRKFPSVSLENCWVRSADHPTGYRFYDLAEDVVSYHEKIGTSNGLAAMFKQFFSPQELERWVKTITGNQSLEFQGRYGENPFISRPELWSRELHRTVLKSGAVEHRGNNFISTYDLTRFITLLGWHYYLPKQARLPGVQGHSLATLMRACGTDSARYADVAIARLGLDQVITSPVILSKLGFGRSDLRDRTENVYVALVQFLDGLQQTETQSPRLRTVSFALMGAKDLSDGDREATELDARMATEVTEILRRLVMDELA